MRIQNDKNLKYTENPHTLDEFRDNRELEKLYYEALKKKSRRKQWLSDNIVAIVIGIINLIVTIVLHVI